MNTRSIIIATILLAIGGSSLSGQANRLVESGLDKSGNGILSVTNNGDTVRVDSINLTSNLWFNGPSNGSRSYIGVDGEMYVQRWRDANQKYGQYFGTDHHLFHDQNNNLSNSVIEFFRRGWNGTDYDITPNGAKMGGIWFSRGTGVGTQERNWMEFNATITDNITGEGYFNWDIEDGDTDKNGELFRLTNESAAASPYRFNRMGTNTYGTGTEDVTLAGYDANGHLINDASIFRMNSSASAAGMVVTSTGSSAAGSYFVTNKIGIIPFSEELLGAFSFANSNVIVGGLYNYFPAFGTTTTQTELRVGPSRASNTAQIWSPDRSISYPGYDAGIHDDTPVKALGLNADEKMVTFAVPSGGSADGNGLYSVSNNATDVAVDTIGVNDEVVIDATADNGSLKVDALLKVRDTISLTGNSTRVLGKTQMQLEANSGGSSIGRIILSGNTAVPLQIRDINPSDIAVYSGLAFSFDSQSNFTAAQGTGFLFSVPGANLDIDADTVKLVDLPSQPWVRNSTYVLTADQNGHMEPSIKGLYSDTTLSVTNGNILSFGTIFADHETTTIESIVNTSASTDNTLLLGTATTAMLGHKIVVTNSDTDTDPDSDNYDTALSATSPISLNGTIVSGYMMARGETVTLIIANVGGSPAFVISSSSIRSGNIHTITAAAPTLQLERGIVLQFNAVTQGLTTNTLGTSDLEHGDELQIVIVGANGGNDSTLDLDFGNIVWDNLSGDATETFNQPRHSFTATWDDVNELLILNGN
ncbi:MAG: hypothetical protein HRU41_39240 [Saprospiraceae bacterium]|nr:hypothetical protein [Saprospiraceae bacterium]